MKIRFRTAVTALVTLLGVLLLVAIGAVAFIYSGIYDIAAREPHLKITRRLLTTVQERSVTVRARGIEPPPLHDPDLVRRGLVLYRDLCVACHGAPGEARSRIGIGLNPNPPPLSQAATQWSDAEIYWIVANGLKMAGMPAFDLGEEPNDLWALAAFVRRTPWISPSEYRRMVAAAKERLDPDAVAWIEDDPGFERLRAEGDSERGRRLIEANGCNSCHLIPGVEGFHGMVGPPLTRWSHRRYIAGNLVNTPNELVRWLVDPQAIEPGTAMPDVGLTPEEAFHIAAYLFTLN